MVGGWWLVSDFMAGFLILARKLSSLSEQADSPAQSSQVLEVFARHLPGTAHNASDASSEGSFSVLPSGACARACWSPGGWEGKGPLHSGVRLVEGTL